MIFKIKLKGYVFRLLNANLYAVCKKQNVNISPFKNVKVK